MARKFSESHSKGRREKEEWEKYWPRADGGLELFKNLRSLLRNREASMLVAISLEAVKAGATAGAMLYLKKFLEPTGAQEWSPSVSILIIFILLNILQVAADVGKNFILAFLSTKMLCEMQNRIFHAIFYFPYHLLNRFESGAISYHVQRDTELTVNLVTGILITGIGTLFSVIAVGSVIFFLDWQIAFLVFGILMLGIPLVQIVRSPIKRSVRRLFSLKSGLLSLLQQSIYAIKYIKAMGLERRELHRISGYLEENRILNMKITAIHQAIGPPLEFFYVLVVTASLFVFIKFSHGGLDLVILGPVLYAVLRISKSVQQFIKSIVSIEENIISAKRVFGTIQLQSQKDNDTSFTDNNVSALDVTELKVEGLYYGYDRNKLILHDITASFKRNELIALMGESGVGKSTFCEVILGLHNDYDGKIFINGIDLRDVHMESYRRILGFVPQEPLLIRGTVEDNLLFGVNFKIDEQQIFTVLKRAGAHDFVMKLDNGIKAMIGERGVNLSGGERQRLCLARALLKEPQILILDEATASVDPENELLILEVLSSLKNDMIILFVTHRMTVHNYADRIFLMHGGRLQELD